MKYVIFSFICDVSPDISSWCHYTSKIWNWRNGYLENKGHAAVTYSYLRKCQHKKLDHKVQQTRNSALIKMSPINPAQNRYMFGRRSKTQSGTGTSVYESGRRSVFGAATHRQVGARPSAAHRTGSERKSETRPAGVYERMCKKVIKLG